jgi:hypothetical protein
VAHPAAHSVGPAAHLMGGRMAEAWRFSWAVSPLPHMPSRHADKLLLLLYYYYYFKQRQIEGNAFYIVVMKSDISWMFLGCLFHFFLILSNFTEI